MQSDTNKTTLTLTMPTGIRSFAEYQTVAHGLAAAQLGCSPSEISLEFRHQVKASTALTVTVRPAGAVIPDAVRYTRNWQRLCVLAGAVVAVTVAATAWQWRAIARQQQALDQQAEKVRLDVAALKNAVDKPKIDKPPEPLLVAQQIVQQDINPYFATLERLQVPLVRLKLLTIDTQVQTMQATYDITDSAQVALITQALNESDKAFSWTLKTMSERQATWLGSHKR